MKKMLSIFTKPFAAVAVIALIASCDNANKNQNVQSSSALIDSVGNLANQEKIAYVNGDSLSEKYELFIDARKTLEEKIKKAQNDLQAKSQAFQREIAEYQEKAPTMSASERENTENRLARKQEELGQLDQKASMSLAEDESKEYEKVYNSIADFLKKHAEENEYSVVLTYSRSNPTVLYADSKLDITTEVLEGLNKEYKENKEKKK